MEATIFHLPAEKPANRHDERGNALRDPPVQVFFNRIVKVYVIRADA